MEDAACCAGVLHWVPTGKKVLSTRVWGASQEAAWQVGSEGQAWRPLTKTGRCGRAEVSPSAALGRGVLSAPESYSSSSPKHTEAQGLISQLPTGSSPPATLTWLPTTLSHARPPDHNQKSAEMHIFPRFTLSQLPTGSSPPATLTRLTCSSGL